MKCKKCENEMGNDDLYCSKCGNDIYENKKRTFDTFRILRIVFSLPLVSLSLLYISPVAIIIGLIVSNNISTLYTFLAIAIIMGILSIVLIVLSFIALSKNSFKHDIISCIIMIFAFILDFIVILAFIKQLQLIILTVIPVVVVIANFVYIIKNKKLLK